MVAVEALPVCHRLAGNLDQAGDTISAKGRPRREESSSYILGPRAAVVAHLYSTRLRSKTCEDVGSNPAGRWPIFLLCFVFISSFISRES